MSKTTEGTQDPSESYSSDQLTIRAVLDKFKDDYKNMWTTVYEESREEALKTIESSLMGAMSELELPWPKDVFGEVPKDDWSDIDDWLRENKGYAIDTVSATLMRRGWANHERLLKERLKEFLK